MRESEQSVRDPLAIRRIAVFKMRHTLKKEQRLVVRAEALDEEGRGVATYEGVELVVSGIYPGEAAEIAIEALSRHHPRGFGRLIRLIEPHSARRLSPCPSDRSRGGGCTGCPLLALGVEAQHEAHRRSLKIRYGLELGEILQANDAGYRMASKRIAFDTREGIEFGSFRRGTNRPAVMTGCIVESPLIVRAIDELREKARALGISSRSINGRAGINAIWLKTDGEGLLLTLIGDDLHDARIEALARSLEMSRGVFYSRRDPAGNALRGETPVRLAGASFLDTELFGIHQHLGPLGFLQPNPAAARLAYHKLLEGIEGGALAFDLYAGAGLITEKLRERFKEVIPCESFEESARALGVAPLRAQDFLSQAIANHRKPDLIVANPPRSGLGVEPSKALVALAPKELRIMSCSAKSFARDRTILNEGFELIELTGVDTLPHTGHLELVARFRRKESQRDEEGRPNSG